MLQLAVRGGQLAQRPVFPERLVENGPRQGFFEHAEYQAVRRYLPPPYQDVLDFAYYSGWRKREILELRWREVDAAGGVVRLSPERSKTRVGRVLPISAPIRAVLARRRAQRRGLDPLVFRRDTVTVRAWRTTWPAACRRAAGVEAIKRAVAAAQPAGARWSDEETGLSAHSSISSCGMDQPSGHCRSLSFESGMEHERTAIPLSRLSDDAALFGRLHPSGGGVDVSEACTNWAAQLSHERSWCGRSR